MTTDYYHVAGIEDIAEFYRERVVTGGVFNARYFDSINRFDINYARTMWIYDNVRPSTWVLDLGCGEGVLALLKRKGVHLAGVDLSPQLVQAAHKNGYDQAVVAQLTNLPFPPNCFDYVVSLDVLGHVPSDEKNAVLTEIKRVLRPDGVTMHGIEVLNRELHQDYASMSTEELIKFVRIDGHIGLEDEDETAGRFKSLFSHVQSEPRYTLCLSCAEFIKQHDEYGVPFDSDFIEYLRSLSFTERRAFDMAMGYVFGKISDLHIQLPRSGLYMLLKAADTPLGPFYNEHRDRRNLLPLPITDCENGSVCLDRDSRAVFDSGWFAANDLPPIARWMGKNSRIFFQAERLSAISLDLTTHMHGLASRPLGLEFLLNGVRVCALSLFSYGWLELRIDVSELTRERSGMQKFEFEIRTDRTWQPSRADATSRDDRQLSIAVCNIQLCFDVAWNL